MKGTTACTAVPVRDGNSAAYNKLPRTVPCQLRTKRVFYRDASARSSRFQPRASLSAQDLPHGELDDSTALKRSSRLVSFMMERAEGGEPVNSCVPSYNPSQTEHAVGLQSTGTSNERVANTG